MTNPKTRKTGTAMPSTVPPDRRPLQQPHEQRGGRVQVTVEDVPDEQEEEEVEVGGHCDWWRQHVAEDLYTPPNASDVDEDDDDDEDEQGEEEEEDRDSSSSFSLQERFNELRARRIRRFSTQSRGDEAAPADVDLINQNRSNKEHERKCKPCQNGFCYCFTSDSGEGGGSGGCGAAATAARGGHVRQPRHSRRSESSQISYTLPQRLASQSRERRRRSAPATFKAPPHKQKHHKTQQTSAKIKSAASSMPKRNVAPDQLTAISRMETTSKDAPLIHIIQELRNNCVISEVRVNKQKMLAAAARGRDRISFSLKKTHFQLNPHSAATTTNSTTSPAKHTSATKFAYRSPSPPLASAPALDKISEIDSQLSENSAAPFIWSSPLDTSSKSNDSVQRRHKAAGRLLQKRLSLSQIQLKPRNFEQPPPKPPRASIAFQDGGGGDRKSSVSTLASTTPSLREAERVLDEFLRKRGIKVPGEVDKQAPDTRDSSKTKKSKTHSRHGANAVAPSATLRREKGKSYPLRQADTLPTCPSLSDIERVVKKSSNYEKNIRQVASGAKPVKELSFGWNEPKIADMLNCDTKSKRDEFKTQAACAQPQSSSAAGHARSIGWKVPPKIDLDTVDSGSVLHHNLASNIETKDTPVKTRLLAGAGETNNKRDSQKYIWGEQWRNLSPWANNKRAGPRNSTAHHPQKSNLKSTSRSFLNTSKRKILRLVSPKKDNKETRSSPFQGPRKTPLRTVGVQTTREDFQRSYENSTTTPETLQSPPGSYHSLQPPLAATLSQQSTTTISGVSSSTTQPQPSQQFSVDAETQFDFARIVLTPPKKPSSSSRGISQRKLNFPLDCSAGGISCLANAGDGGTTAPNITKTYRSFNSDLDQHVTLSNMGYILGNIRAKLEASDEHAIRTFEEIERREQRSESFDIPDSHNLRQQIRAEIHRNAVAAGRRYHHAGINHVDELNDPIYSEIEEDSFHISCSPQFDNKTGSGVEHFAAVRNPEALYAKVNKTAKPQRLSVLPPPTLALGRLLHDSMRHMPLRAAAPPTAPLPPVPSELTSSSDDTVSYSSPPPQPSTSYATTLSHCQSLNNIRVMEHHSPPKLNRNLNKSDLSLHRSEIFLENLCRSEIIVEAGELERLEKVDNRKLNCSYTSLQNRTKMYVPNAASFKTPPQPHDDGNSDDSVSYEMPHDSSSIAAGGSHLGLSIIAPPQSHNQSTPNKAVPTQTFTTKRFRDEDTKPTRLSVVDISIDGALTPHLHLRHDQSSSCPTTPHQLPPPSISDSTGTTAAKKRPHAVSLDEVRSASELKNNNSHSNSVTNLLSVSTVARFKRLKNALRKSLRKSKNFVKTETKRLSTSLSFPLAAPHSNSYAAAAALSSSHNQSDGTAPSTATSILNLDTVFALDESTSVAQQLAKAVSICRQMPDLEISPEMVEAERLLLFSSLRQSGGGSKKSRQLEPRHQRSQRRFFIDAMQLPVRPTASQDLFFNYFYIGAFECGGVIRSTQSVECRNNEAIFQDCGIEFACAAPEKEETAPVGRQNVAADAAVRCDIFMLRLRKVSTLSLEPPKSIVLPAQLLTPSPTTSSSSFASRDEIVSRFRLHASFTMNASDFAPFEYVESESKNSDQLCLRAAGSCSIPLTLRTKSTNLASEIVLSGRAEARFPKHTHSGFLNVQEPHSQHNWNRRWCTLDGLQLHVWQDANDLQEQPLLCLDLRANVQAAPLEAAPRELCARLRSFCLQCAVSKVNDAEAVAAVFFAADTHSDLAVWLQQLNAVLDFVVAWLR